jgi:hypothetical protein
MFLFERLDTVPDFVVFGKALGVSGLALRTGMTDVGQLGGIVTTVGNASYLTHITSLLKKKLEMLEEIPTKSQQLRIALTSLRPCASSECGTFVQCSQRTR